MSKCGAKTNKGPLCENKGKEKYEGRCGIHKNYESQSESKTSTYKSEKITRDNYLLDSLPAMNRDITNIIDEYSYDDDMKYNFKDKEILEIIHYKSNRFRVVVSKYTKFIDPYFLLPDGKINYIKVSDLHERICDYLSYKKIEYFHTPYWLMKFFLTNSFRSVKNVVINTIIDYSKFTMAFLLDGKLSNSQFEYNLSEDVVINYMEYMEHMITRYRKILDLFKSELKLSGVLSIVFNTNIRHLTDVDNRGKPIDSDEDLDEKS